MEIKESKAIIKAILFAHGEPLDISRICDALGMDKPTAMRILVNIADELDSPDSGMCIVRLDDKFQLCAKPKYAEYIRRVMDTRRNTPLSQVAMEVLAVIAYNQPVTRSFVSEARGVDCSSIFAGLVSKDLIEEKGRLDLPGRPIVYGTTLNFLRCFSISSLSELPPIQQLTESQNLPLSAS